MGGVHELYLIRHGVAEERGPAWPDDTKRPLTGDGISRLKKSAAGLRRLGVTFDVILTSPLTRTRQTADVIAAGIDPRPSIVAVDSLAPDGSPAAVLADLEKHARRHAIALVGHEPNIGELAARLLGARRSIEFKKGAVCRIDVDTLTPSGPGALRWFLTPKMLRTLRR
jgi:phosphohistidine phosphatase